MHLIPNTYYFLIIFPHYISPNEYHHDPHNIMHFVYFEASFYIHVYY